MEEKKATGQCLCGDVQYEIVPSKDVAHCHCESCRKLGAILTTWMTVQKEEFEIKKGNLVEFKSSDHGKRLFCGNCHSQIALYTTKSPKLIDISVATLDSVELYPPDRHIWSKSKISWLKVDPELPQEKEEIYP
jgi:hypothetical protein